MTAPLTPDRDGWVEWHGGERPVPANTLVLYQCRWGDRERAIIDSTERPSTAGVLRWKHTDRSGDIIAYRVVQP